MLFVVKDLKIYFKITFVSSILLTQTLGIRVICFHVKNLNFIFVFRNTQYLNDNLMLDQAFFKTISTDVSIKINGTYIKKSLKHAFIFYFLIILQYTYTKSFGVLKKLI